MIKKYLTCERYLENYNNGEKTIVGRLDTPEHVCVTETDMAQEAIRYDNHSMLKIPRHVNHYLVGPIADALHAYEELGYSPEELKKIIDEHKKIKTRLLYISTGINSMYGTLSSPFGKKVQEMREALEREKLFHTKLDLNIESLYPQMIFKTNTPNKNNTIIKESKMENKKFTKADLKVGYVVKTRAGELYMVMINADKKLVMVNGDKNWMRLYAFNDDLTDSNQTSLLGMPSDKKYDIMEVYGYSRLSSHTTIVETSYRDLLWKREEKTCDQCIHKVVCSHVGMCEHFAENK